MRCDIVVGGTDKGYIRTLVQFLLESNLNQFNITTIDTSEELRDAFYHTNFSVYLVEEPLLQSILSELNEDTLKHVLALAEPLTHLDTQLVQPILKYQKASNIEKALLDNFHEFTTSERVSEAGAKGRVVSFYSPIGGVGTTMMAQIFAQIKCSKGYKVLFISLESQSNYKFFYNSIQHQNMSDYMVFLLSHTNWLLGLERMVAIDVVTGVHYFEPVLHSKDLAEFQVGIWPKWCDYITKNSDYDYLVLDIGKELYKDGMALLESSHHRFFLTSDGEAAVSKWSCFSNELAQLQNINLLTNKTLICNQLKSHHGYEEGFDALFCYDELLVKEGKEGQLNLNPYSTVYRQMEALVNYV